MRTAHRGLVKSALLALLLADLASCAQIIGIEDVSGHATGGSSTTSSTSSGSTSSSTSSGSTSTSSSSTTSSSTSSSSTSSTSSSSGSTDCHTAAFPSTPVLDTFEGDAGLDPMWSVQTPGGFSAQNGQLVGNVGTPGVIVWSDSFGPSLEAYLTVAAFDPSDSEIELILKNQGLLQECDSILVDFQPNGGGDAGMSILGIYACLPNSPMTILQEDFTLSEGDVFGARVCSDGTLLVYKNGVIVTTQDTSPFFADATSEGKVGLFAGGLVSPARFQRFGGGTVP